MKIDLGELYKNKATLDSSVKNVKSTIQSARDYLQALADSEALQGKVKTAIDAKLKNHQIPLMTNYLTALSVLSKDYTTLLQTFKDTVGEKSNRAIIDTDALRDLKKPFSGIEQGLSVIQRDTAAIYESIADIIELANPSTSQVIQDLHAAKQVLTDTESKMAAFNQLQSRSSFEEMMTAQEKELKQLSALQDLGYTNKKALSYYQRTDFVTSVAEAEKKSNSQVYRLALQNELAKKLKTSKYSGKISIIAPLNNKITEQDGREFKKNLQAQYGFDEQTANILWKLYRNILRVEGKRSDYVFNRLIGGIVYDNDNSLSGPIKNILWNFTAGGHQTEIDIVKKYKIKYKDLEYLKKSIRQQHAQTGNRSDFAHQSITTATILQPQIFPNVNNGMWAINSNLGKTNSTNPIHFTSELAGWRGDVTGQALATPNMGNDDYKADLDAVNISSLMSQRRIGYVAASNLYYHELEVVSYTRAEQFIQNIGGQEYLYSEVFKAEDVKDMNELRAKNSTAYNFLKSLNSDIENGKGGNPNEYTDFKE